MKKNISINISGIIFHIEEDAFDRLKAYLDSINRYFSTFDDSQEIIADIESRIAEIFLSKLSEDKQVITTDDVEALIATMGSISDFQAVEDPELDDSTGEEQQSKSQSSEKAYSNGSKKLFRDEKRKIVGGVCAGIAHYFSIDALWVRLLFTIILLGSAGFILIAYFVMWAVIPGSEQLPEDKKLKKMFRDSEHKALGGVAAGIANYFGVDIVVIRVLFVISIFLGGFGLITYIILWIILPEAKTISDKVQMKGDPITLTNIESNIKQSLNVKDDSDENVFVKILLFPFRLIAIVIDALSKALGPIFRLLVDFIRIIVGASFIFGGIMSILALIIAGGVVIGLFSSDLIRIGHLHFGDMGLPLDILSSGLPSFTLLAAFFVATIPSFLLIMLGASLIAKRIVFSSNAGWTVFAIFMISAVVLAVNVPTIVYSFKEDGTYEKEMTFKSTDKTTLLKLNDVGLDEYDGAHLKIRGYDGAEIKLVQVFEAQGRDRREAEKNAQMVTYNVETKDSVIYFDSNIEFEDNAVFRAQRLHMTLYIPYGTKFTMDDDLRYILNNNWWYGYRSSTIEDNVWTFTRDGLDCMTCPEEDIDVEDIVDDITDDLEDIGEEDSREISGVRMGEYDKSYDFDEFDEIDIKGAYIVNIEKSDNYRVLIKGRSRYIDDLIVRQDHDRIRISHRDLDRMDDFNFSRNDVEITILTPNIKYIELVGATKGYISNFNLDDVKFDLMGASSMKADITANEIEIELTGASNMELRGKGRLLVADVIGASHLDAYSFKVDDARLEATGVSSIKAYVTDNVRMDESFISNIKIRGGARVNSDY
ncbi:PspC domain-containing protein [Fulvivirga lutimaris]|uniref:PspC domain-containing protein n=1 Tax=Fulvivirga lutimaris TaxID=1819566 RepID=UPI0012BD4943|nr:PspC domain-containing protein [Fulvivirga lutimaris]MTI40641.1 PspC domain-containing protein [Fulvivirga lutimaris]